VTTVLGVAGSGRRGGNSDAVLEAALEAISGAGAHVEMIVPAALEIRPCQACGGCWETGQCVVQDDMQELYRRFELADHLVVASPLYFTSLPGHLKSMIDRFQCFWVRAYVLHRPVRRRRTGMFLCVSAMDNRRYYDCTLTIVRTWMSVLNVGCAVSRFYPAVDGKDDLARSHPEYLEDAREAALELLGSGA